jgi:ribose-phosphate pyrophosphokinase
MNGDFEIFSGSSNPQLAKKICHKIGKKMGEMTTTVFGDGEIHVKYEDNIRGKEVFLLQSTCKPAENSLLTTVNDAIMELLLMIDAAKRSSATNINVVIPYFAYARQDRKETSRVPISAKLMADLLTEAGATRVISVDLHSQQTQGFFNIPMDNLYCYGVVSRFLKRNFDIKSVTIVSPDAGGMKNILKYVDLLGTNFSAVHKKRFGADQAEAMFVTDETPIEGQTCFLIDDLTSSCGTLVSAANMLKDKGAKDIYAFVSHCCLNKEGYKRLSESCIKQLITTDTIASKKHDKVKVLSVADLLGSAILRTHDGRSISDLFIIDPDDE